MSKAILNVLTMAAATVLLWILLSWVDVLCHNDPVYGDRAYSPFNAFCVLEEYGTPK